MPNQALEQSRDSVLRYGESVGCELLNFVVRPTDRVSSIACGSSLTEALTRFLELIETPVVVGASTPVLASRHSPQHDRGSRWVGFR
jgi:hypothetical protein